MEKLTDKVGQKTSAIAGGMGHSMKPMASSKKAKAPKIGTPMKKGTR